MKLVRRLLGFLLAVMMVAAICPVQALAYTVVTNKTTLLNAVKKQCEIDILYGNQRYAAIKWIMENEFKPGETRLYSDALSKSTGTTTRYIHPLTKTNAVVSDGPSADCYPFTDWFMYVLTGKAYINNNLHLTNKTPSAFDSSGITKTTYYSKTNWNKLDFSNMLPGTHIRLCPSDTGADNLHSIIFLAYDKSNSRVYYVDCNFTGNGGVRGAKKVAYGYVSSTSTQFNNSYYTYVRYTVSPKVVLSGWDTTPTYTITYNANGGTNAPAAQTKTKDVALTLSSTEPTRTGYNFLGWATTSTASSAQYSAGSSYTANANVTLYAVWEAKTYAVRYDANGGTGAPATQNKVHDKTLALSSVIPHYEGHVFKEWRDLTPIAGTWTETKPTSGVYETRYLYYCYGYEYNNDMTFWYGADKSKVEVLVKKNLPSGISYDAKKLRYITYISSANAGSSFKPASGGTFTANYTNQDGSTGTAQIKNTEMYYKAPVYKQDSVSSVAYQPGGTYTANHDVTLVAVWEEAPTATYTISYNGNGGSAPGTQTKTQGSSIRLSTQVPTRTGYTFKGWATSATATAAQYQPGDTYTADADLTLYAVWKINSYAITYYDGSNVLSGLLKNYGESVQIITGPTKEGYTFKGWATNATATTAQYQPGDSCTLYADLNLYAVWEKNAPVTYTVSFNANGGTGTMSAVGKVSGGYTLPACSFTAPTGKQFKGWATSPNGAVITGTYNVTANITFYAIWEAIPAADGTTIQVGKAVSVREKEVVIPISLSNNTGVASMNFKINYDKTRLQLTGFEDAQMTGWMVGVGSGEKAIWVDENGSNVNGDILSLKFMVLDTAEDGLAEITVTGMDVVNVDEEDVSVMVVSGGIEVISRIPGDTNDDGKISAADVLRLKKYLAGMEVEINLLNADVTGDGKASAADLLRLKKYFAGMDAVLE